MQDTDTAVLPWHKQARATPTAIDHAHTLARLSANEMVCALGLGEARPAVQAVVRAAFVAFSMRLARVLAHFDDRIDGFGLARAAAMALADLGATWTREGPPPPMRGPLLVVANHPGSYDAFALLAAMGRDDVAIIAADRRFLRALPSFARHLVLVPEGPHAIAGERMRGMRRALRHLGGGGAVVHFGAGRIEPDPAFSDAEVELLAPWPKGTGALVRGAAKVDGSVAVAILEGVHSRRAKRAFLTRLAERRGITTFAPLLQMTLPRYRRVEATVRFAPEAQARELAQGGDDVIITARVRDRARALLALLPRG